MIQDKYKKFKEDVLGEEKNEDKNIIDNQNNDINSINDITIKSNCTPILDFYIKNSALKAKV